MPRLLAAGAAVAAAVTTFALAAPDVATAATPVSTPYLLQGSGSGLKLVGGSLPAGSGTTSQVVSGCMNKAPTSSENHLAGVTLPGGLGSIGAVTSHTWTSKLSNGTVNRYTQSKVASITIGNDLGSLNIQGLTLTARAWHDKSGFHATATTTAASVTGKIAGVALPGKLPTPTQPIEIPGLLKLTASDKTTSRWAHGASSNLHGLMLTLDPTGTRLRIGAAWAQITDGIKNGIFGGYSAATKLSLVGSTVSSSGQPVLHMPCKGTGGKTTQASLASVPLSNAGVPLDISAANSSQVAGTTGTSSAWGHERSSLAEVNLNNGALVVKGLVAQANANRHGRNLGTVTVSKNGTKAATVTLAGQSLPLSALDGKTISVPGGLAKIQTGVATPIKSGKLTVGIDVVGLRITLLDVNNAVKSTIDLATARFKILHP